MNITPAVSDIIKILLTNWSETERTVELSFLFSELPEPGAFMSIRILDVGCCESSLVMKLNDLGFDSWGIDMRDYVDYYPKFIRCDARAVVRIPDSTFDVVMAISTIEHIGLVETPYNPNGFIDKTFDKDGDIKAISEMVRIVKPGKAGKIIITLPYGDGVDILKKWIRFYDKNRIEKIIRKTGLVIDKIEYHIFRGGKWSNSDEKECARSFSAPTNIALFSPITGNVCISGHKEEIGYND